MTSQSIPHPPTDDHEKIYAFFLRCSDLIKERASEYEPPAISLAKIALYWQTYTDCKTTPYDVAIMMALLKIARLSKGHHQDSLEDAAAYLALANSLKEQV
jgi:Domain of unknown function (DUF6378)